MSPESDLESPQSKPNSNFQQLTDEEQKLVNTFIEELQSDPTIIAPREVIKIVLTKYPFKNLVLISLIHKYLQANPSDSEIHDLYRAKGTEWVERLLDKELITEEEVRIIQILHQTFICAAALFMKKVIWKGEMRVCNNVFWNKIGEKPRIGLSIDTVSKNVQERVLKLNQRPEGPLGEIFDLIMKRFPSEDPIKAFERLIKSSNLFEEPEHRLLEYRIKLPIDERLSLEEIAVRMDMSFDKAEYMEFKITRKLRDHLKGRKR